MKLVVGKYDILIFKFIIILFACKTFAYYFVRQLNPYDITFTLFIIDLCLSKSPKHLQNTFRRKISFSHLPHGKKRF